MTVITHIKCRECGFTQPIESALTTKRIDENGFKDFDYICPKCDAEGDYFDEITKIKVITLWQPWASFIALGWKTIETRTHDRFKNLVGETIGIHAGNKWDNDWKELAGLYLSDYQIRKTNEIKSLFQEAEWLKSINSNIRGSIICTARITAANWLNHFDSNSALIDCSEFMGIQTRHGLYLSDVKPIQPIPAKGKQGIWNYDGEIKYL